MTFNVNRQGRGGGGVAVFLREEYSAAQRNFNIKSVPGVENLNVVFRPAIGLPHFVSFLVLIAVYIPPDVRVKGMSKGLSAMGKGSYIN